MPANVLLIVMDTARRDALEPYGAPAGSTPTIRDLAAHGSAVARAYATASWTLPSHASMLTGMLPRELGVMQAPGGAHRAAAPLASVPDRLLPEVLRRAGYTTRGWSANVWVSPLAGFDAGFDEFHDVSREASERMDALLREGPRGWLAWLEHGLRGREDDGAALAGRGLRESIARHDGTPTFWFVNLTECHSPYLPPRPWNDLDPWDRVLAVLEAKRHLNFKSICRYVAGAHAIPAAAFDRMRHLHGRAASYLDHWLADVLGALDARGLLEETLVIVTSDHGENFGEGGLVAHGFSLDERLIHVPLVMAGPGAVAADQTLSLAELPRIIARAAEMESHPWESSRVAPGIAVSQYDPMGRAEDPVMIQAARDWGLSPEGLERIAAQYTSATDGSNKLVVRNGQELLYDLRSDPGESSPLDPGAANGAFAALRTALEQAAAGESGGGARLPHTAPNAATEEELRAIERQMKLLGYM